MDYHCYDTEELTVLLNELTDLRILINDFETDFMNYLQTLQLDSLVKLDSLNNKFHLNSSLFISFNYTRTLESLYGIPNVIHIHGILDDNIKIGYNSEISYFDMSLGDLDYPEKDDIIIKSKHDLPDLYNYYTPVEDDNGAFYGKYVPNRIKYDFHNEVSLNIVEKKERIEKELYMNDKSKYPKRLDTMKLIKETNIDEVIIYGHSLGEMDHDFFDELFKTIKNVRCSYKDKKDKITKMIIISNKSWPIKLFKF